MKGQNIIITGATSGIGEVTAVAIAKTGAKTIIISRSEAKCQKAVANIKSASGNQDVHYLVADLSSIAATRAVAQAYKTQFDRLDVLINNAGGLFNERRESVDGYEMNVALNHIGPFVLTMQLLELLKQTASQTPAFGARIVNVSSSQHSSGIKWDNLMSEKRYSQFNTYGQSKAMTNMFTFELARRLEGSGVTVNALDPGRVKTNILKKDGKNLLVTVIGFIAQFFFVTPEQGAETSIYLATSDKVAGVSGKYFAKKQEKTAHKSSLNPQDWARLWAQTEEWVSKGSVGLNQ